METAIASRSTKVKLHDDDDGEEIVILPEEIIIEELLPRLPVKSLLRFRCVSKSWCSLISGKIFMKSHLRNSIKGSSLDHHRIVFYTGDGFKHCSLPSLFSEPFPHAITDNADFGVNYEKDSVYLVGVCTGLVSILINRKRFILWNPTTKKFNYLPDFDDKCMRGGVIMKYGFGLDELNDDYKVFGVLSVLNRSGCCLRICKVYSLSSDSWEIIEGGDASSYEGAGTFFSGKLHWDANESGITSFDLNNNVYGAFELPSFSKDRRLGVFNGCLSMHCFHQESHVDIWVMKEYGVKESWDKVITIRYYHSPCYYSSPTAFTIGPNGELLLSYNVDHKSTLLIYNPKSNVFRHLWMAGNAELTFLDLGIYVESLASVVPYAQQEY